MSTGIDYAKLVEQLRPIVGHTRILTTILKQLSSEEIQFVNRVATQKRTISG